MAALNEENMGGRTDSCVVSNHSWVSGFCSPARKKRDIWFKTEIALSKPQCRCFRLELAQTLAGADVLSLNILEFHLHHDRKRYLEGFGSCCSFGIGEPVPHV